MIAHRTKLLVLAFMFAAVGAFLFLDLQARPQLSSDGRYSLITSIRSDPSDPLKHLDVLLHVSDLRSGRTWTIDTNASNRMRWQAGWDSGGRMKLESADIGTHYWELIDWGWRKAE